MTQEHFTALVYDARNSQKRATAVFEKAISSSYAFAYMNGGIEEIVYWEFVVAQLEDIQSIENIAVYQERITQKLISDNPSSALEVIHYKAMRYILDKLRYS